MGPPRASGAEETGSVEILRYEPEEVVLRADMPRTGFVLLLDTYFPGWKASVDDKPARLLRADYAFRAVRVPAGVHIVRMVYRPASFRIGLAISLAALAFLILLSSGMLGRMEKR